MRWAIIRIGSSRTRRKNELENYHQNPSDCPDMTEILLKSVTEILLKRVKFLSICPSIHLKLCEKTSEPDVSTTSTQYCPNFKDVLKCQVDLIQMLHVHWETTYCSASFHILPQNHRAVRIPGQAVHQLSSRSRDQHCR